jgi:hypothetical protein
MSLPLAERAWHWSDRAGIAFWDSLILAAAELSGCQSRAAGLLFGAARPWIR